MKPKLRAVQPSLVQHEGNSYVVLGDPLRLVESTVAIPQALTPLLALCDGTRDLGALRMGFELRTGIPLSQSIVEQIILRLDDALLLENERFDRCCEAVLQEFRSAPCRPPALAGRGYPASADELGDMLRSFIESVAAGEDDGDAADPGIRGVISPHIDFQRGGPVYARVWSHAAEAIAGIDLAIVLGTDHFGGRMFTLTKQSYATPWGVLPTAGDIVDRLTTALGGDAALADELHHRNEHSIELALIWLHYFLGNRSCEVVPILCGSFQQFIDHPENPEQDAGITAMVDTLRKASGSRKTLVVAAADLAHMGPAFGDRFPIDVARRAAISTADDELIGAMCASDAEGFFSGIKREKDRRRICGLAPIYLALRLLGPAEGKSAGYAQCPADAVNGSLVSICGVVLR